MHALILHQRKNGVEFITQGLARENIYCTQLQWDADLNPDEYINGKNACILYYETKNEKLVEQIRHIRRHYIHIPTISIDTTGTLNEKSCDLLVTRPYDVREVAIAVKRLSCSFQMHHGKQFLRAYDLWLDLEKHRAKRENLVIPLRNKEFALLEFFLINHGKVLTRQSILEFVWDRNAISTSNTVDVHVNRLRRKIDDPFKTKLIHTVPCVGYKLDNEP